MCFFLIFLQKHITREEKSKLKKEGASKKKWCVKSSILVWLINRRLMDTKVTFDKRKRKIVVE